MTLTLVQSDTAPALMATLRLDSDAQPIDLTGATVKFQMRGVNDRNYRVDAPCTVITPSAGTVSYTWASGDLSIPGDYIIQFEITFSTGKIQTTAIPIPVTVRRQ